VQLAEERIRTDAALQQELFRAGRQDRHHARIAARRKRAMDKAATLQAIEECARRRAARFDLI
jgi:hypothetical protein